MSSDKKTSANVKRKKKLTEAQMQLAIIKKRELDSKALKIVEKLLETDIDSKWLLENLGNINQCHMEDVIEERSIEKLCGYVLCKNPITKVISKRYHISTSQNKVYDISRRKKFCSSYCYSATNYLLEQMLTSPLWLRENEKIPEFRILPVNEQKNIPGEEVFSKPPITKIEPDHISENDEEIIDKNDEIELNEYKKTKTKSVTFQLPDEKKEEPVKCQDSQETCKKPVKEEFVLKEVVESNSVEFSVDFSAKRERNESKFKKEKKSKKSKETRDNLETFESVIKRIERNFREWVTQDTLRLLFGEEAAKQEILNNIKKQEQYVALCEKLKKIQIQEEEEEEEEENIENKVTRPVPNYSELQEEAKMLQLKVRAFYEGRSVLDFDPCEKSNEEEDVNAVGPLVDSQAPNLIRRRIFIDKINSLLQDIMDGLASNCQSLPVRFNYSMERVRAIKTIISTFALTAENIIFKSTELTLVSLIIIKMLSTIDPELKNLLNTKEASLFTSMILMSYQLNSDYLDTFMNDLKTEMLIK